MATQLSHKTPTVHSKVPSTPSCKRSSLTPRIQYKPENVTFESYTLTLAQPWVSLQLATTGLLPAIITEAAVPGVLSVTHVTYGIYAHSILAEKLG